jgi:carboxyl-terminal processing protease
MSTTDAANLLRGNVGATVTIEVWRQQDGKYHTVTLKREQISMPSVTGEILPQDSEIAYVRVLQFNQSSTLPQLSQAFADLNKKSYRGMVLDLRDNPGGDLQTAVDLAGYFVPPGPVVRIVDRSGAEDILRSSRDQKVLQVPLVVLVNGGTASASEIVAGAIKDTGSGVLIGTRTFGKGVVQTVFPLNGQVGVKLTTYKYLTPKGIDINKKGIDPDMVVNQAASGQADQQLEEAIQVLQKQIDKAQKQAA